MNYEPLGADVPKNTTTVDTAGVITSSIGNVITSIVNAIAAKKQQERQASSINELQQIAAERAALERQLAGLQAQQAGPMPQDMLVYGSIAAVAIIAILLLRK